MTIRKKKIDVRDLRLGMYVSELDRPWLGTPFLFQGFPIKTEAELRQLRDCCAYVLIDTAQSRIPDPETEHFAPALGERRVAERDVDRDVSIWETPEIRRRQPRYRVFVERTAPGDAAAPVTSWLSVDAPPRDTRFRWKKVPEAGAPAAAKSAAPSPRPETYVRELTEARQVYRRAHEQIGCLLEDARLGRGIDPGGARELVDAMADSIVRDESALVWLTQLKNRDEYTSLHSINVCIISLVFGRHLGMPHRELRELGLGALLHDLGKMRVPLEILNKPGEPDSEELTELRRHPVYGYELLKTAEALPDSVLDVVYSHHERIDGSGYPRGLKGDQISVFAMIVSIADVYDAVTSDRVYHSGISPHEALSLIYEWGPANFDPDLLQEFIRCLGIYPIGSIVELNTGEIGVVMSVNKAQHLKPLVSLVLDADKQPYDVKKLMNLDLMARAGNPVTIRRILESGAYGINAGQAIGAEEPLEIIDP